MEFNVAAGIFHPFATTKIGGGGGGGFYLKYDSEKLLGVVSFIYLV